ncbi:MAG: tRNA (guanine-N7-)-methyltransferase [Myxococcota bacterium]|jgi:tRNA (guanine-N7-)-methyltransferase
MNDATPPDDMPPSNTVPDDTAPTDDPFADGHGLVGGFGDKRRIRSRQPPLEHRWILAPYDEPGDLTAGQAFFAEGNVEVEIGFARGHFLRDRVRQARDKRFLGVEIKRAWCQRMVKFLDREELDHTRIILGDARPLLLKLLPAGGVDAFYVFFPDPWWKKRHHKRRVISAATIEVMHRLLKTGGAIEVRTDVEDYANMVESVFGEHGGFERVTAGIDAQGRPLPPTHREKKCAENGAPIFRFRGIKK